MEEAAAAAAWASAPKAHVMDDEVDMAVPRLTRFLSLDLLLEKGERGSMRERQCGQRVEMSLAHADLSGSFSSEF